MPRHCRVLRYFYPRSPCGERRGLWALYWRHTRFLSTLSLRRATWQRGSRITYVEFLSTLSLRRATEAIKPSQVRPIISIHALLAESDSSRCGWKQVIYYFYPRSPCGERPIYGVKCGVPFEISIHALLAESDVCVSTSQHQPTNFYPRSPCGERPLEIPLPCLAIHNFYPRSPCGERHAPNRRLCRCNNFYPRSPCGERPRLMSFWLSGRLFLSTLSLRRATWLRCWQLAARDISIHALLAESDALGLLGWLRVLISIHALLAESDSTTIITICIALRFLSTLSLRRATESIGTFRTVSVNFYPRSPCGERRLQIFLYYQDNNFYPRSPCGERHETTPYRVVETQISIHALLAESDGGSVAGNWRPAIFLSTLSLRRATSERYEQSKSKIHFYPRSPCGERLSNVINNVINGAFLSTLSLRRATNIVNGNCNFTQNFYPRSPCGERHNINSSVNTADKISIHALLAESDSTALA